MPARFDPNMHESERVLRGLDEHERQRAAAPLPDRYEVLAELGRGGMAVVWRARDRQLGREVAVKMLRDDLGIEPSDRERFRREAEVVARLSHPNVITVFDAGANYIVMELVEGGSLERDRFSVELLEKVSRAVHAAHERGIVHRDLKPSNILLTRSGEPKVADFGIAHLAGKNTRLTQSGMVIGTPQYMAPEQADGLALSPRTDIYALGAILYEGLTGRCPHEGLTAMELLRKIVGEEPELPRALDPKIARDLETITMKALEKDPSRRYVTAGEFADDLRRWREGAPILARPASALYRLRKRIAKRLAAVVVGLVGAAVLAAVLSVTIPTILEQRRALRLWTEVSVILHDADTETRAGDLARARGRLEAGLRLCSSESGASAPYFLGRLLRAAGRRSEAIAALDRAIAMNPGLGEARFERGLALVAEYESVLARVQTAYAGRGATSGDLKPPSGDALERLHPTLADLRARAIADLEVDFGPARGYYKPIERDFGRAQLACLRWEWEKGRGALEDVVRSEPRYAEARLALARSAIALAEWDAAIRWSESAIAECRGLGPAHAALSDALFWKTEASGLGPDTRTMRERALRAADAAIELGEPAHVTRGNVRTRTGDFNGAIADYTLALAAEPRNAVALNHRGVARAMNKDTTGALADFTEAIEAGPGYAMAYFNRALVRMDLGQLTDALADAERAVACAPANAPRRADMEKLADFLTRAVPK